MAVEKRMMMMMVMTMMMMMMMEMSLENGEVGAKTFTEIPNTKVLYAMKI